MLRGFRWAGKMLWERLGSPLRSPRGQHAGAKRFAPADAGWYNFTNTYRATRGEQGQVTARLVKVLNRHINMNKYIRQRYALQAGVLWLHSVQDRAAWRGGTASARARVRAEEQLRGEQVWEGIFSHRRLQTVESGRGKPDKAMYPRPNTWRSPKANSTSESKLSQPRAGSEPSSMAEPVPITLSLCGLSPEKRQRVPSPE